MGVKNIYFPCNFTVVMPVPEISEEERGRRAFQLHRDRAVDAAIERIRESLGPSWRSFSQAEVELLRYLLGESWIATGRRTWERFSFSRLDAKRVAAIIELGRKVRKKEKEEQAAIGEVLRILESSI